MIYRNIWDSFLVWADKHSRYHKWDLIFGIGWLREPIPKINFWYGLVMWADTKNGIRRVRLRIRAVKYGSQSAKLKISLTPLLWLLGPTTIPWTKIFSPSHSFACRRALTALLHAKRCRHWVTRPSAAGAASFTFSSGASTPSDRPPLGAIWKPLWPRLFPSPGCLTGAGRLQPSSGSTATPTRFPPVRPGRDRERRRGSSKIAMTAAWRGLLQGPPKRRDPGATERQICAAADLRSDGGAQAWSRAFNNGGKHRHPHRGEAPIWIRRRQARIWAGGRPRRRDLDLQWQPTTPPSLRGRRPPPSSTPRSGPGGLGSVWGFFSFKNWFWVSVGNNWYQKVTNFCIGEMVSVGSTDTYNLLSTDMKNCFCNSACIYLHQLVCCKHQQIQIYTLPSHPTLLFREVDHPNIVRFIGSCTKPPQFYILTGEASCY
jgi:hypothetical protein